MTIKPVGKKLKLLIEPLKVGAIQTETIAERGVIIDVGHDLVGRLNDKGIAPDGVGIGTVIYFKAWAVDVITHEGEKHYFIDADSTAICGYETT